jgi:hypothetical protein
MQQNTKDLDKLNTLLHFMKGCEPFSATLKDLLRFRKQWCPFQHDNGVEEDCYNSNQAVISLLAWIEKYITCCKYLDINRYVLNDMTNILVKLRTPVAMTSFDDFQELIDEMNSKVAFIEKGIHEKLDRFTCHESERLDEALVCFENYCFYGSIVMSVSALESRIIKMIRKTNEDLYLECFEKATLGQLIQVFEEDKYKEEKFQKVKELMPPKHTPLITLLNQYRVFSAHPKNQEMTAQIAESVLHLSFNFMMDKETCPYNKDELKC